jgi:hypothetical protein
MKTFKNKKKNYNNKLTNNNKAFVIYDDLDFISSEKIIEAVCNDMDYQILKIDDLEIRKLLRFQKISEATQSKRISSVPDSLNNKVDILEKILNNNTERFLSFFNSNNTDENIDNNTNDNNLLKNEAKILNSKKDKEKEAKKNNNRNLHEKNHLGINNLINISKEITDFYTSNITKEREVFKAIKHNMMKFVNNKKTLILISDTFSNIEESKSYINSILGKVNETKTPIIILTSKLILNKIKQK